MVSSAEREVMGLDAVIGLLDALLADREASPAQLLETVVSDDLSADAVRTIVDRATALRVELAQSRRRENELSALFTSARELAELRDVGLLLHRLVLRAHELIGTDVTYLSVYEPGLDELHVRATAGTITAAFEHLVVPPGVGLAARVVRTRAPQWAARYDTADVPHIDDIDDAVAGEGLVALLGVPMIAGGRETLGVLFAANRYEHSFRPDQVALLSAFADHAAVVLETARLLAQATASETETRRARDRLAVHVEAMERASVVHERLTGIVLRGGGANDVCDTLSGALGRPVTILDRDHHVVAEAGATPPVARIPPTGWTSTSAGSTASTKHWPPVGAPGARRSSTTARARPTSRSPSSSRPPIRRWGRSSSDRATSGSARSRPGPSNEVRRSRPF